MKLLLHICCAPCVIYPFRRLKEKGYEVAGLFYNPNIHPFAEYKNRRLALESYAKDNSIEVFYPEYMPQDFFRAVNLKESTPLRCEHCWGLRLQETARCAKQNGFNAFSTTLLVSPYQGQDALKRLGLQAARQAGVDFYYEDFRPGFRQAHDQARAQGIYCQKYCGCLYSEIERHRDKQGK